MADEKIEELEVKIKALEQIVAAHHESITNLVQVITWIVDKIPSNTAEGAEAAKIVEYYSDWAAKLPTN